ncbi:UNVERIFIED_CONTAM: putative leucine-rich repeat receptor-like protein kinase [Sesamum radiatum]|uniref:non-specific serine/threonine protein kinase n=1 Tax=Sesamum radiatum TaxID=300843 RepID=A0AAW2MUB3_SESRA
MFVRRVIMNWRIHLSLLVVFVQVSVIAAWTDPNDFAVIQSLKDTWDNVPPNWSGADPCGNGWSSISCVNNRVVSITLVNVNLTGQLPSDVAKLADLQILILVGCGFSGQIPPSIGSLQQLVFLSLNSNKFIGGYHLPLLSGDIPPKLFSSKLTLIHLLLENNQLAGSIPNTLGLVQSLEELFKWTVPQNLNNLTSVQELFLANNMLTGPLPNLTGMNSLNYVDLSNNSFDATDIPPWFSSLQSLTSLIMENTQIQGQLPVTLFSLSQLQTVALKNNQINGTLDIGSSPALMFTFRSHSEPVDSVSLSNPTKNLDDYLSMTLQIFPSGQDYFNHTGISEIGFMLSNQTFKPPAEFGPFFFIGNSYPYLSGGTVGSNKSSNTGIIIGAAAGGTVLVLLLLLAGFYAFRQKKRAETAAKKSDPFASWDPNTNSGGVPQLKGAKCFSFEELKRSTNNFSETNEIGSGGYGKVYRGILSNGQLVAIKRAQQGSMQGGLEFKTEIELLSRVHHKNVVSLVGFCFEHGEQMLVYEYIANGTLKDSLSEMSQVQYTFSGRSGIRLDWMRRLRIALGAARGVQYLHDLADPPIIHRDIKSNNILLDERLNAKVADFGLSKPLGDSERGHVTTQVKGTMGYLDPEYYMTQQLTEKSDVYSFGILLELLTSRSPIEKGKYIVREMKQAMDMTMYNLQAILDPIVASGMSSRSVEFFDLSLRCVQESGVNRPTMSEVVKEIESIMEWQAESLNLHQLQQLTKRKAKV